MSDDRESMLVHRTEPRFGKGRRTRAMYSFALLLVACAKLCEAADYAREERWVEEVASAIVVGDPVYLATPARAKVFAIIAEPSAWPRAAS